MHVTELAFNAGDRVALAYAAVLKLSLNSAVAVVDLAVDVESVPTRMRETVAYADRRLPGLHTGICQFHLLGDVPHHFFERIERLKLHSLVGRTDQYLSFHLICSGSDVSRNAYAAGDPVRVGEDVPRYRMFSGVPACPVGIRRIVGIEGFFP